MAMPSARLLVISEARAHRPVSSTVRRPSTGLQHGMPGTGSRHRPDPPGRSITARSGSACNATSVSPLTRSGISRLCGSAPAPETYRKHPCGFTAAQARPLPVWCPGSRAGTRSRQCRPVAHRHSRSMRRTRPVHHAARRCAGNPGRPVRCRARAGCPSAAPARSGRQPAASAGRPGNALPHQACSAGQENPQCPCLSHGQGRARVSRTAGSCAPATR